MSRIKELKNKEWNKINIVDLYQKIICSEKTKYFELLEKLMDKNLEINYPYNHAINAIKELVPTFNEEGLTYFEIMLLYSITQVGGNEKIVNFNKFIEYNERNLIEKNDVTSYKSFEELENQVNIVDIKLISKELEKQVITLFNNDDWIVIKPLSFEASKKYGANTTWCTTMTNDPSYFYKYFRNGILIYCVNKKTGYRVAAYKRLSEREISFWNQVDKRIDSFESDLPGEIIGILKDEFKNCNKSNYALADVTEVRKEMAYNNVTFRDGAIVQGGEAIARRGVPVHNVFDGGDQEMPQEEMMEEDGGDMDIPEQEQPMPEQGGFTLQELEDALDQIGEQIEPQPEDEFVEMGREEIMEALSGVKSKIQTIEVDEDYMEQPTEIGEAINVPIRVRFDVGGVPNDEVPVTENAICKKESSPRVIYTDDDEPVKLRGTTEGFAGIDAERALTDMLAEEIRGEVAGEAEAQWPEDHGINVAR